MKVLKSFAILGVMLFMTSAAALAQGHVQDRVTVDVPFAFTIGSHQMPAGKYTVSRVTITGGVYYLRNDNTKEVRAISDTSSLFAKDPFAAPRLVFRNYDGRYFLSQVWTSGGTYGSELHKSKSERELALTNQEATTVAIAAE